MEEKRETDRAKSVESRGDRDFAGWGREQENAVGCPGADS